MTASARRGPRSLARRRLLHAILAASITSAGFSLASQSTPMQLVTGKPVDGSLKGGDEVTFRVPAEAGQVLEIVATQKGIDVVLIVRDPAGKTVAEIDSPNGTEGPEEASLLTAVAGDYLVIVKALEPKAAPGRFDVVLKTLRAATRQDRAFYEAWRLSLEAARGVQADTPETFKVGIAKYQQAAPLWQEAGRPSQAGGAFNSIAILAIELRDYELVRRSAEQSAAIHESLGEYGEAARALNHAGIGYAGLLEIPKAIATFERALALLERSPVPRVQASLLSNLAQRYQDLGLWRKALEMQLRAQPHYATANDPRQQAAGLDNLAMTYHDLDEHQRALDAMREAVRLRRLAQDKRGESTAINNLGLIYYRLGEYRTALTYYEQALSLWKGDGERDLVSDASTLLNISLAHRRLGDDARSRTAEEESMRIRRAIPDPRVLASGLQTVAAERLNDKSPELTRIIRDATEALTLWQKLGNAGSEGSTWITLGRAHMLGGDLPEANSALQRGLDLSRRVGNLSLESTAQYRLAQLDVRRGAPEGALARLANAMEIQETLRNRVTSLQLRGSFFSTAQAIFGLYVDVAMQLHAQDPGRGLDRRALEIVERARARSLLEGLTEAGVDLRSGVPPELLRQQQTLQDRIAQLTAGGVARQPSELDALLADLEQVRTRIRTFSPMYASIAQPQPLDTQTIQRDVVDADSVLIEYAFGETGAFVWAVTPEGITSAALGPSGPIISAARRLHELASARNMRPPGEAPAVRTARLAAARQAWPKASGELSRLVLGPVASRLKGKRIVIAPAGILNYVPFASLPMPGTTTPLVAMTAVTIVPSASAVAVLRRDRASRPPAGNIIAVLADPVFAADDPRVAPGRAPAARSRTPEDVEGDATRASRAVNSGETILPRLRYSRDEAESIVAQIKKQDALLALDFRASRDLLTAGTLANHRIIHLATHGLLSGDRPEVSGLAFSMVNEQGAVVDGFLRLHEIYGLRLNADLVVLSACQTALGQDVQGEGIVGLTRGFMSAGAARVVSSLWKVDDQATAELMKAFYRNLLGPARLPPADALRAAQNQIRAQPRWSDAYYWAGFALHGDWR